MTICTGLSISNTGRLKQRGKLTQSLSFWTVGTPISSNVLGPLPGSPGFWLAEVEEEEVGGLGVDGADSLAGVWTDCEEKEAADGDDMAGRGEATEPCEGGETGVLAGFRSGAPSRRGGRRRGSAPGDSKGAE